MEKSLKKKNLGKVPEGSFGEIFKKLQEEKMHRILNGKDGQTRGNETIILYGTFHGVFNSLLDGKIKFTGATKIE